MNISEYLQQQTLIRYGIWYDFKTHHRSDGYIDIYINGHSACIITSDILSMELCFVNVIRYLKLKNFFLCHFT